MSNQVSGHLARQYLDIKKVHKVIQLFVARLCMFCFYICIRPRYQGSVYISEIRILYVSDEDEQYY